MAKICFVIEDNYDINRIFATVIRDKDIEVEQILQGDEALRRLHHVTPHLIILDMHLPGVDGIQILDYILAQDRFKDTVIIVVSADHAMTNTLEDMVDYVLLKPVEVAQLSVIIDRVLPA
jgi:CheY-like chemotaxis protein